MKARAALLEPRGKRDGHSPAPSLFLPILGVAPMGPDSEGECPFFRGPETDQTCGA